MTAGPAPAEPAVGIEWGGTMAVMRTALRSPLATLVPLLLLVPATVLLGGCSSGDDVDDQGPTVTATGPRGPGDTPTEGMTEAAPSDGPTTARTDPPAATAAVCGPYLEMARAIKSGGFSGAGAEEIAAAIAPAMKEFAGRLPTLERPPGMSAATWRGMQALAVRILDLPDRPTYAEIEAVEDQLSEQERDAFEDAADWLRTNCSL